MVEFVQTAHARSFRAAAEELGVTSAAVSKAVKRLEGELGVTLLHRTTRRVTLSDEGEAFLARCEDAIALVSSARAQAAAASRAPRGRLTISLSHVLGPFVIDVLGRFRRRYPGVTLQLELTDRRSRLVDDRVDVALRVGKLADSALIARRLWRTRWVTVASPAYLATAPQLRTPDDLTGHACIRFRSPRGKTVPWTFADSAGTTTRDAPAGLDLDHGGSIVRAALAELGVAQVFDFMVSDELSQGRLVEVLADHAAPGPDVHALTAAGQRRTPRVRVFLDYLSSVGAWVSGAGATAGSAVTSERKSSTIM